MHQESNVELTVMNYVEDQLICVGMLNEAEVVRQLAPFIKVTV